MRDENDDKSLPLPADLPDEVLPAEEPDGPPPTQVRLGEIIAVWRIPVGILLLSSVFASARTLDSSPHLMIGSLFVSALAIGLIWSGVFAAVAEGGEEDVGGFIAWGRVGGGLALTLAGLAGKLTLGGIALELDAILQMAMIAGPIFMAWASYSTFICGSSQRQTGVLMVVICAGLLLALMQL